MIGSRKVFALQLARISIGKCLILEEALLRRTQHDWCVVGSGLQRPTVVLGMSGVASELIDSTAAASAEVDVLRRFTGGGTVVADQDTFFGSLILNSGDGVPKHPREIMAWTSELYSRAYAPLFGSAEPMTAGETQPREDSDLLALRRRATSRGFVDVARGPSGPFHLSEHDYCFGPRKVGGNAQTITRGRFVHHTSFLTNMDPALMRVLKLPPKRPAYRGDRSHEDFLTTARRESGGLAGPEELASAVVDGLGMWFDDVEHVSEEDAWEAAGMTAEEAERLLDVPVADRPKKPFDRRIRTVRERLH